MSDYLSLMAFVVAINAIPVLMPPTWVILALAKINDPGFNPLLLALAGATASTIGRAILTYYSGFFRKFFDEGLRQKATDIKKFFDQRPREVLFGAFLFSLSPLPSNLMFVAGGLTKIKAKPLFAGFFLGRLVSYFLLILASHTLFAAVEAYTGKSDTLKIAFDALGLLAGVLFIFVDWKKLAEQAKGFTNPM